MRLIHYETLKPICPNCKLRGGISSLKLQANEQGQTDINSGLLVCESVSCGRKYPIIFGCPILVPDIQSWLTTNLHLVLKRNVLDETVESLIGETVPPESFYNIIKQQQSSYCCDHYAEEFTITNINNNNEPISTIRQCLKICLQHMPNNNKPSIDIGCAVGRTTFEIAANRNSLTLGIDLNWPLLDIARTIVSDGIISYSHRVIGNRYYRRERPITYPNMDCSDFWIADACCMPFNANTFGLTIAMNIIDCLNDPEKMLNDILSITVADGGASLGCPFDWTSQATNQNQWIYGDKELDKKIRNTYHRISNDNEKVFVNICAPQDANWTLPLHERSKMTYLTRLYIMRVSSIISKREVCQI